MQIKIPAFSLVLLVGPSGSGKSTFAARHFLPTEVISSDHCRALVSDDENNLEATADAFDLLHHLAALRLKRRKLVVIDATNVQPESRRSLIKLARTYHCFAVAILFDLPEEVCRERNRNREDRDLPDHVIRKQRSQLGRSMKRLRKEGIRSISRLRTEEEVDAVTIVREKLWTDRREEQGPFDIIGDLHGCCTELESLLEKLGYEPTEVDHEGAYRGYPGSYRHPEGRRVIFVGDLVDRGPRNLDTLFLARNMVATGDAICVPGNHDVKFMRWLQGRKVTVTHGLEQTVAEVEALEESERTLARKEAIAFIDRLVSHYELDDGNLVVAHAGMKEEMQGRASGAVREFALYGETTGESDELGLPVRLDWAARYRGTAQVVYGHTPVPKAEWLNRTINIDTGAVFGGRLTALRYPELELVSVAAEKTYCEPARPFLPVEGEEERSLSRQQQEDRLLDADDLLGKLFVETAHAGRVTVRAENGAAALEVMSRFAVDPRWLIYLPPTMAPVGTGDHPDYLERPEQAFSYYRGRKVSRVICQEKHMGSRAIVLIGRSPESVRERFGVTTGESGVVTTRTGRHFFPDGGVTEEVLALMRASLDAHDFWNEFETDWILLDCELMPWSEKARLLLQNQYAAVGSAAEHGLDRAIELAESALASGLDTGDLTRDLRERRREAGLYRDAYRHYCWPVTSVHDLRVAPFHIMATEGRVHTDRDHTWHLETIDRLFENLAIAQRTERLIVEPEDPASCAEGVAWWEKMTASGGEGMVVKPIDFIPGEEGARLRTQPAVKVRGREYLRIIYGPEYTRPHNLERLRDRNLGRKRSLALREFALGIESLSRFVNKEPLRRVHEAVFALLALESEPVDPRL